MNTPRAFGALIAFMLGSSSSSLIIQFLAASWKKEKIEVLVALPVIQLMDHNPSSSANNLRLNKSSHDSPHGLPASSLMN